MSACLSGFQCASAPQAGQGYLLRAVADTLSAGATPANTTSRATDPCWGSLATLTTGGSSAERAAEASPVGGRSFVTRLHAIENRYWRNWVSAERVMRHCVPIFLPFRSPASRLAITSASDTPSTLAASAGDSSSGTPAPEGGA